MSFSSAQDEHNPPLQLPFGQPGAQNTPGFTQYKRAFPARSKELSDVGPENLSVAEAK
ncbi:MAG TPA: hypothetical protein VG168_17575 [Bryobacteraceae bacterium]|jgi:hypothetical protein|nr:hypothetical protein [Bryobacteraceae bacterium]